MTTIAVRTKLLLFSHAWRGHAILEMNGFKVLIQQKNLKYEQQLYPEFN